jgi:RNase P subunit RPR2
MKYMTLLNECVNEKKTVCTGCNATLTIKVLSSAAGHYIGFFCSECGPYSRESGYYKSRDKAEDALQLGNFSR